MLAMPHRPLRGPASTKVPLAPSLHFMLSCPQFAFPGPYFQWEEPMYPTNFRRIHTYITPNVQLFLGFALGSTRVE